MFESTNERGSESTWKRANQRWNRINDGSWKRINVEACESTMDAVKNVIRFEA